MFNGTNTVPPQSPYNSQMGLKRKGQLIICPSQNNQVYLFQVQMDSTNSNDVAKNLLKNLKVSTK